MTTKVLITNIIWKHFYIILFLSFSMNYCQFGDPFSNIDSCDKEKKNLFLNNTNCFNNILKFDQKKYQLNNFAKNENDDIFIQFSEYKKDDKLSSSRLFYGLSKDGRYFFLINRLILSNLMLILRKKHFMIMIFIILMR